MKNLLLSLFLIGSFGVTAQIFDPTSAYTMPEIGLELFKTENPYITTYGSAPDDTSQWIPFQRWMRYQAPNVPYTGIDKQALNDNSVWTEVQQTTNNFTLNGSGQVVVHFNDDAYNYPGYNYRSKSRDSISYNTQGKIEKVISYNTNPPASNNYVLSSTYFLQYDSNGKRLRDSLVIKGGPSYIIYYTYDTQGNLVQETMMEGADTSYKYIYQYNNNQLMEHSFNWGFDKTSDEWTLYGADTFEYTNGLVSKHIGYGLLFSNGNVIFGPFVNESYTYTPAGKLASIERFEMDNEEWLPDSKTIFTYGTNNKPSVGYTYAADGAGWNPIATEKYLFDDFITGLPSVSEKARGTVFPNPVHEVLNIETNNEPATLVLTDINGRTIFEGTSSGNTQVSTTAIPNGMYFVSIRTNQGIQTQRIVIKHP